MFQKANGITVSVYRKLHVISISLCVYLYIQAFKQRFSTWTGNVAFKVVDKPTKLLTSGIRFSLIICLSREFLRFQKFQNSFEFLRSLAEVKEKAPQLEIKTNNCFLSNSLILSIKTKSCRIFLHRERYPSWRTKLFR